MVSTRLDFEELQVRLKEREIDKWIASNPSLSREELRQKFQLPTLMSILTSDVPEFEPNKYWHNLEHPVNRGIKLRWDGLIKDDIDISVRVKTSLMSDISQYQSGTPYSPVESGSPALYYQLENGYIYAGKDDSELDSKVVQPAIDAIETGIEDPVIMISLRRKRNKKPGLELEITPGEVIPNESAMGGIGWYTSIDARPVDDGSGDLILYCSTNNFKFNYHDFVAILHSDDYKLIDHLSFF